MANPHDIDPDMEEDYDEEADSDFDMSNADDGSASSSSENEQEAQEADIDTPARPKKRRKLAEKPRPKPKQAAKPEPEPEPELDSGDEATLKEAKKVRRRQRKKGEDVEDEGVEDAGGWRAKTRSMREREQEAKKVVNKLASIQGSTVDVDALWAKLNAPDALKLLSRQSDERTGEDANEAVAPTKKTGDTSNKENIPATGPAAEEEMITIKRTYNFAGETHTEEKVVPKSSAEAKLWLAQQASKPQAQKVDEEGRAIQRPLRKVSRFDPNFSNIDAFKGQWAAVAAGKKGPTGPKLNVVEKSKMDWASHVDAEGLKEELDVAAKAKNSYLHRTDFLRDVEQRKDDEARAARLSSRV